MQRKNKLPKLNLKAQFMPATFNEERLTVEVIFTTDAPVVRRFMFGDSFKEVLGMNEGEVRLERFLLGAPVLNNHNNFDLKDQIGVVLDASVDGEKGLATIQLSGRESVREIVEDVKSGVYRNISVGYVVHEFQDVTPPEQRDGDEMPTFRAVDWEPMELSIVSIPADRDAQIRKEENEESQKAYEVTIRGNNMSDETMTNEVEAKEEVVVEETVTEAVAETETEKENETEIETKTESESEPASETNESEAEMVAGSVEETVEVKAAEITKAERSRISEITNLGKKFDIDAKEVETFIENENSVEEVRKYLIDKLAKEDQMKGTKAMNENKIEVGTTDLEKKKEGIENAMLSKSGIYDSKGKPSFELNENGKRFHNMSLIDMAKEVLEVRGVDCRNMSRHEVAQRAFHSTSDFKQILANVLNKSLRSGYEASPQTFGSFTRMVEVDDLKEISRTQFGEGGLLKEVKEGEEYKHDTVSEAAEKYSVKKYGKIVNVTEETLINDDLAAFTRIPAIFGQRARDLESDLAWGIIIQNAALADGFALFSNEHGNLLTGAPSALQESSLSNGRSAFRKQVGLDGMKLNLMPMTLAVPVELETQAEKLVSSIQPESTSSFNPFGPTGRTPLSIIVEPRLSDASASAWYLMGSLGQIDMVEMAMLRGQAGPMITQMDGFDVDGVRIKIKHWVGVKALDFRGLLKSDGQ